MEVYEIQGKLILMDMIVRQLNKVKIGYLNHFKCWTAYICGVKS